MAEKYWWEEEYQKKKSQQENQGNWWEEDYTSRIANKVGNDIMSRVNTWLENHNNYLTNYKKRYSGRKNSYEDSYVSDSGAWLDTISKQKSNFDAEYDSILAYMDQYSSYLDASWVKNIRHTLNSARNQQNYIINSSKKDNEYWTSFTPNEEQIAAGYDTAAKVYGNWQAERKQYDYDLSYDVEAAMLELEGLKKQKDAYLQDRRAAQSKNGLGNSVASWMGTTSDTTLPLAGLQANSNTDIKEQTKYDSQIAALQEQIDRSKYVQTHKGYMDYMKAEDFDKYSRAGAAIKNPTLAEVESWDGADIGNIVTYSRDNDAMIRMAHVNNNYNVQGNQLYINMTDDEVSIYNYLLAKYGKEKGEEYLSWLADDLSAREGKAHADRLRGIDIPVIEEMAIGTFGLLSGVDQWAQGARQFFTNEELPTSAMQYANQDLMNSMDGLGKYAYQATNVVGNMVPSIALSKGLGAFGAGAGVAKAGGLATMGVSASGNAYAEGLRYGMEPWEARVYGNLVGASEVALEYFIGKTPGLSRADDFVSTKIRMIDNSLLRVGSKIGWDIVGEITEEELQNFLEPAFRGVFTGEYDAPTLDELLETAIVTAISTPAMGGAGTIVNDVRGGRDALAKYGDKTDSLIQEGLESDVNTDSYKLAQRYQQQVQGKDGKSGKALTGNQIRNLLAANQEQITPKDMKLIQQAAEKRLSDLGQTEDVSRLAELATKWATGGKLTSSEKNFLTSSKYGSRVANELMPKNIASGEYTTDWAEEIGTREVNREAYNKKAIDQVRSIVEQMKSMEDPNAYKALESRVETDSSARVSDTGNAVIRGTEEEIDLTKPKIKSITEDSVILDVNGKDVNIDEIDFADEDQWNMFNALKKIEHITPGVASSMIANLDMTKPVWGQLNGMDEAFTYGYHNYSEADLKAGSFTGNLTKDQLNDAYNLGKYVAKNTTADADAPRIKLRTAAEATVSKEEKAAKVKARIESDDVEVYFEDGGKVVKFTDSSKYEEHQMAAVNYAKFLYKLGIGGKYYFYDSYVNDEGVRVYKDANGIEKKAPNGWYDENGNIHIDLNAGNDGQGTTLFTLGHELTHFIKAWSESKFRVLADFLIQEYGKTDMSMHERVLVKQKALEEARKKSVSYDEAFEEVVADAMSTMLTDGNLHEKLVKLKTKDKGLFNKIKQFFDKLIAKFQALYKDLPPEQQDALDVRNMKEAFDKIQTAFAEALVEASDNFHAAMESVVEENAKPVEADEILTEGAVVTDGNGDRFSIRSMKHDIAQGKMFEDLKTVCGWTVAQVETLRHQLNDLVEYMIPYRNILDMNETYGMEGRRFSPYKPNSDPLYKISMDFSTLCSKRLLTQYVIEQLQLREKRPMSAEEQMAIRDMLNEYRKVEKGLQVACAMCYVEAARLKSPKQIQRWLDDPTPHLINYFALKNSEFNASVKKAQADFKESKGYDRNAPKKDMKEADVTALNKIGPKMRSQYQPSAEEQAIIEKAKSLPNETYLTAGNLADLSENESVIYNAYTSFVRTATRSKSLEKDEPYYYGDSARDNGNGIVVTDSFIEAVNRENGMRFSSWSDWRIQHLLDYITAVIDNSVRGAAMHGYTKFGDEVRVLGKTGMMFNMSGVAGTQTGLNEDGTLNFSPTESIDVNEAIQLREEFPEHAGLQCIGVSDAHIIELLKSDIIDYVIPYHVSGLNAVLRRMVNIYGWKDYTGTQHAAIDKSIKFEDAVDREHWHEEPVYSEFFVGYDTGMFGIDAMRASAEKYKQMCKDRGLTPKFNQFATEPNYWKLLIDRKMINQQTGKLIKQKAVTPTFDFDTIKGVVDKFVDNHDAGLEARALNHIVENWDSIPQRIKDLKKQGSTKAKKAKNAADTLANQTVAAQPNEAAVKNSDREFNPDGKTLDDQLEEILKTAESFDGRYLYIGRFTPGFINMVNRFVSIKNLPIVMNYRDAYLSMESKETGRYKGDNINYHNLGKDGMKSAIESIGNPEQVLLSNKESKIELVLESVDYKGNKMLSIVALNTSAQNAKKFIEAHIVTSIYGRRSMDKYVAKAEREGRLIYSKKEESVQGIPQVQYKGDINTNSSFETSVAHKVKEVKSERTGNSVSNRSLLANAFEWVVQNSKEYEMLQEYKEQIGQLNELEARLSELNSEIHEIRFTKGKYDSERLHDLETEAKNIAKEINKQDKKLLQMEASEPLRKVIQQERKKEAEKTKAHVKEIQQNKKVRAEQTELRHKIRKAIRDLDTILNRGNKKRNVKEDMKGFASKALDLADYLFTDHISNDELIRRGITVPMRGNEPQLVKETQDILSRLYDNADSLADEEFTRLDEKRKRNMEKLSELLKAQRNERLNTPVYNLFNDLVTEYAKLKNSKQDAVKAAYNPEVERFLRSYIGESNGETDSDRKTLLQNMRVADMTTDELWRLHNAYKMVLHTVRTANDLFVKGKAASIQEMADKIVWDFTKRKIPEGKVAIVARNLANKMGWDYEKLHYALDRIGSEAFAELVMNIANSENIVMQDVIEATLFRDQMVEKYGFNNWKVNKEIDREFLDNTGKKFKLTLGQMMALYAYSRREGAWDHIEYGGFVFGEAALTNPRPADSYKLSKEQCEAITGLLTAEQKGYVEDMQKFLSETMGEKGNEVSMMLYGIRMFEEKNYFPIHIAGQFKAQAQESQAKNAAGFGSMSNAGFTHAQNPNAKAPFVLEGFNEIWVDHVNEMSRYHGTVPALEDMRRVMNRSSYSESGAESMAIKQLMENSYGKAAVDYFDNLYREANSGAITDKLQKKSKKLLSLFRKNSVAYSLSVIVQQPTAMIRAYAMIDKKYFGFKGFGTITSGIAKAVTSKWNPAYANAYNEMLKYAPGVTMAKEIGGFDTATGGSIRSYLLDTNKSTKQKWKTGTIAEKGKAVLDIVDDNAIANLPTVADKIAWIEIWNACKRETVAKHKDLTPNSEEFMKTVGDRFTEVIRATQVYDSIFAKSPMLKSKNLAVQYLVSFMNEPNTVANMVEKSVRDVSRGNVKAGVRTATYVVYSVIFNNLLKSMIYAMRDDDEDEAYTEKYIEAVVGNMMNDFNPLTYIPVARDVWSIAQGYDVERADMAIIADSLNALTSVIKNATTDTDDMTEEQLIEFDKKVTEANWKLVESVASFFGIPAKNIRREVNAFRDHARIASANAGKTTGYSAMEKAIDAVIESIPFMSADSKQDKLYDAILSGDTEYVNRLKAGYKDEDAFNSAVRKTLRENDPRIREAAQAYYSGNIAEYKRIFKEIRNDDKHNTIGFDNTMEAVMSEVSKIKGELEPKTESSAYTATDFVNAIMVGSTDLAQTMKEDIISYKVENGESRKEAEKAFSQSVATSTRNAFDSGLLNEAGAEKMLQEYAGMDEEEAAEKTSYWAFIKAHPQYRGKLSESNVGDYHEFAEPAQIPLDVFVQYLEGTSGLATIYDEWGDEVKSKREQVLEVIDSLPLTWQQKDALYLAAGYAESKIWDVPW